jgi:hypothetical protein
VKRRAASRLAWGASALTLVLTACMVVLAVLNPGRLDELSFSIVGVAGAVVGGVVASKRPDNPVGWLFLFGALISAMTGLTAEYAIYGILTDPGALPAAATAAWFSRAIEIFYPVLTFILMPLYFPTGRPVSRRWGLVAWLVLVLLPFVFLGAFSPGEAETGTGIQNPLVIEAVRPLARVLDAVVTALYLGLIFASAASLVVRFWRSAGVERQQIKWVAFAAAFIPIWFMTNAPIQAAFPILFQLIDALVIAAVPVAAGIAILRYRLYDIDLLINRTLVYAALTATLVLIYLGGVVVLQRALAFLTGEGSQLAVVASTLAIAALFNPLRRRIQGFIDRRFYRRKYDARKTLEAFSAKLREETDLDALSGDLMNAVRETMRPAHVSVWLRELEKGK